MYSFHDHVGSLTTFSYMFYTASNDIQATFRKHHQVSYGVPLCLRTLFCTVVIRAPLVLCQADALRCVHTCHIQLHRESQSTLHRHHKVSCDVPLSLVTLLGTI